MPIYEYHCPACKSNFEQLRPMSQAAEPVACPTCGKPSGRAPSRFICKTKDNTGYIAPVGGCASTCSSCNSSSCSTCGG